jgi:preprotein translocase SecE subunit
MDIIKKTGDYMKGVSAETKRVTWPSGRELWESTLVVIAFIIILSAATGACDFVVHFALKLINN